MKPLRLRLVVGALAAMAAALALRVAYLQTVEHSDYRDQAAAEHVAQEKVIAHRGSILDRNGRPLATTMEVYDILVRPDQIQRPAESAEILASILDLPYSQVLASVTRPDPGQWPRLARSVPYEAGQRVAALYWTPVRAEKRVTRLYPEGNMAASVLGFVGRDHVGLAGLEADFNAELMGRHGTLLYERDSVGRAIPLGERRLTPPHPGSDVVLTIDRFIQRAAEVELDRAIAKHQASGGVVIVANPRTGELLAVASRPSFDLSQLDLEKPIDLALFRNRAVTDQYEPGSIFKVITMAAAVDGGVVRPTTTYMDTGVVVKYGWPISNWDGKANGLTDMVGLFRYSANVGAVWVADRVGPPRFYDYVRRFGFGVATHSELSGEAPGAVRDQTAEGWRPIDLSTNSFGQGISVTPLQMIAAVGAVVNGGVLMRPYVVKEIRGPSETRRWEPVAVRRVIAPATSTTLREMLHASLEEGEGTKLASVPAYKAGGKTGTASIPIAGGYSERTIASFVGFLPYDNPDLVILIRVDEPRDSPWGSVVASPVFRAIAQQAMHHRRVPPASLVAARSGS